MKKFLNFLFLIIVILLLISGIYIYNGYSMYKKALDDYSIKDKVASIKSVESYSRLEELPKIYINAVIAIEDHRFYKHNGIDVISIGRALYHDLKNKSFDEGGSTITQQLAKNIYFSQEKKIERKIAEVFMAFKLEHNLEKDEILELYLNTSYFGNGYYTVKEASMGYFSKEPAYMTDYESTLLAGIPNAPSIYGEDMNLAHERQKQILELMVEYRYLSLEEKEKILEEIG
ncbi:MAG TPA: glycosyl transferase [Firmicutes bacterium]|nr:glycosyl transferase [Bacillota bacterium]